MLQNTTEQPTPPSPIATGSSDVKHFPPFPLTPLSPFVIVEVTAKATVTIAIPDASGLNVSYDATSGAIGVSGAGISFTDPGTVGLAAARNAHDPSTALRLLTGHTTSPHSLGGPLSMNVQISGKSYQTTIGRVTEAVSLTAEDSDPAIEIDTRASFSVPLSNGQSVAVTYGIVTDLTLKGQLPFHGLPVEAIQAMLFVVAGYAIPAGAAAFLRRFQDPDIPPRGAAL